MEEMTQQPEPADWKLHLQSLRSWPSSLLRAVKHLLICKRCLSGVLLRNLKSKPPWKQSQRQGRKRGKKKPHWMEPWTWVRRQSWVQAQPHPSLAAISTSVFCWNWSEAGEFNTCLLKCGEDQIRQRSPSANQVAITHGISSNYLFIPF